MVETRTTAFGITQGRLGSNLRSLKRRSLNFLVRVILSSAHRSYWFGWAKYRLVAYLKPGLGSEEIDPAEAERISVHLDGLD